jgi:hypothetical protein
MPIHDLGYRRWTGTTTPAATRWWILARSGISLAWKAKGLKQMVIFAWAPALYLGVLFFVYELLAKSATPGRSRRHIAGLWDSLGSGLDVPRDLIERALEDPAASRSEVWSYLIYNYFRLPQAFLLLLLVGIVAPPMISRDVRSRAFLLYFSRPITRLEYLLGKAGTVWFFSILITTAPALTLFVFAVLFSPSFAVLNDSWHVPLRVLAASVVLLLPTTALALCFSSMTRESRLAAFGWFAVWVLGWVSYSLLRTQHRDWTPLSLYHTLGRVQSWVFGITPWSPAIAHACLVLLALTGVAFVVLLRRTSAPLRV